MKRKLEETKQPVWKNGRHESWMNLWNFLQNSTS